MKKILLASVLSVLPFVANAESLNIKLMEKLNNQGISWIEYSANPKKYEKKLKD